MIQPNSTIGIILVVIFASVSLSFFLSALYQRYRLLQIGREESRFNHVPRRLAALIPLVLGQWTLLKGVKLSDRAGITHFFIFWGGIAFVFGYVFFVFGSAFSDNFATRLAIEKLITGGAVDVPGAEKKRIKVPDTRIKIVEV